MGKHLLPKGSAPLLTVGYTTLYVDTTGNLHLLKDDGTDITVSATTLASLTDVLLSSPTDGQVLTYDSATSKWANESLPTSSKSAAERLYLQSNFR